MAWPTAKRRLLVSILIFSAGIGVCGWQAQEHARFRERAKQALVNRGNDITETLRIVVRSQRRWGPFVTKERLQPALEDFIRSGELEAIAFISATGEPVARAGKAIDVTPAEIAKARGVLWNERTLTLMNLTNWDPLTSDEAARQRLAIVVDDASRNSPPSQGGRPFGGRPRGEEFDAMVQKQGQQSIVIALPTVQMHRAIKGDLLLRSLVCLLAMGGAVVTALAWRNMEKNAELQIRLVKAGEMNTHLKEMNLAAAGLAHETRNPLNLIRGLAQMIAMQAKEAPKLKEHAATIVEEADRVTVQLNEFINYSKPREVQLAPVPVARLVADVARTLVPDLEEKNIQLHPPESTLSIEADEQLMRQALFNVLLNATQAVGQGGRIDVRLTATGPREAMLEIADDGPGVPEAERASIFRPYVTMRPKGVGLGLAIVAQIASAHHWEVTCVANEPRGAVFRFRHLKIAAPTT
jgi:signal transduction histidine kinase